jgi:hypothetical protein
MYLMILPKSVTELSFHIAIDGSIRFPSGWSTFIYLVDSEPERVELVRWLLGLIGSDASDRS